MARERRVPAEWEPQAGVLLTWPHGDGDWGSDLDAVHAAFAAIGREVSRRGRLISVCADTEHAEGIRERLEDAGADLDRCRMLIAPSDDSWARDHGPLSVETRAGRRLLDMRFDGWGGKYPASFDDRIPAALSAAGVFDGHPMERHEFTLEGGALESDGRGTLLGHRSCLLDPRRNPGITEHLMQQTLAELLGIDRVLWLSQGGLIGDDTDAHIDTLARFLDPTRIAYQACDDPDDPHHGPLSAMAEELAGFRTVDGQPYELIALPLPPPILDADGRRLPAGYANFLFIGDAEQPALLVPTYGVDSDRIALQRLAQALPDREVIGIDCRAVVAQNGSLHCITMQFPAGTLSPD